MSAEYPEGYRRLKRKSIKTHKCCECKGLIKKGEIYNYHSGIWDEPASFKVCDDCENLKNKINSHIQDYEEKIPFGCLYEYVFEGKEINEIKRFIEIVEKRNAVIPKWIYDKYKKISKYGN